MSTTTTTTWLLLLRFWGGVALFFSFVLLQRPVVGFDQQESTSHHLALEALPLPSPSPPPPPLRVHVVPHSHDDSGWLKTYLQYYWGDAQHIQVAGVKTILDSVVDALVVNPSRKFSFAEMSFFMLWWGQQSDAKKAVVRTLVAQGRLDFVNGGFVQHDEASAHYVAMIDQTTRGHLFLKKEFGFVPRVGWQIDPFGHSSSSAGLLGRGLGFDALFFGRADWEDMAVRKARKQLEFLWKGSGGGPMTCDGDDDADNGGDNGLLFTGNFASGNYGPPEGFNFEFGISDTPIQDDPSLRGFNVEERVEAFVAACEALAGMTRGNEIMLTMGSDFHYAAAEGWFGNLDRLMAAVNARGDDNDENGVGTTTANGRGRRVEVFYSTPYAYVKAKAREAMTDGVTYPVKVDDFFPYSDAPEAFWTGYFTSRPTSKRYIRMATSFLQAARQLEAFVGAQGSCLRGTDPLEEAVALTQHHDSVTGTERQAVADDYHIWISEGMEAAREVVGKAFTAMYGRGDDGADEDGALDGHHHWCPLLNVSSCEFTVERDAFTVTVYNPTSFDREIPVSVPVSLEACDVWRASGPDGGAIDVDVVVNAKAGGEDITNHHHHRRADANVVFLAPVQAMGMASFLVSGAEDASQDAAENNSGSETLSISNDLMRLEFDPVSGLAQSIAFLAGNATAVLPFTVELAYYNSSDGLDSQINRGQSSGAYIFRPNGGKYDVREPGTKRVTLEIIHGAVVSEARQTFNEWGSLVTRLYKHKPYLEVEWTAGPLPLDAVGREVVVVYRGPPSLSDLWTDGMDIDLARSLARPQRTVGRTP
jgi:alpha-mannosidase